MPVDLIIDRRLESDTGGCEEGVMLAEEVVEGPLAVLVCTPEAAIATVVLPKLLDFVGFSVPPGRSEVAAAMSDDFRGCE